MSLPLPGGVNVCLPGFPGPIPLDLLAYSLAETFISSTLSGLKNHLNTCLQNLVQCCGKCLAFVRRKDSGDHTHTRTHVLYTPSSTHIPSHKRDTHVPAHCRRQALRTCTNPWAFNWAHWNSALRPERQMSSRKETKVPRGDKNFLIFFVHGVHMECSRRARVPACACVRVRERDACTGSILADLKNTCVCVCECVRVCASRVLCESVWQTSKTQSCRSCCKGISLKATE